jgi:hypothetical protein
MAGKNLGIMARRPESVSFRVNPGFNPGDGPQSLQAADFSLTSPSAWVARAYKFNVDF